MRAPPPLLVPSASTTLLMMLSPRRVLLLSETLPRSEHLWCLEQFWFCLPADSEARELCSWSSWLPVFFWSQVNAVCEVVCVVVWSRWLQLLWRGPEVWFSYFCWFLDLHKLRDWTLWFSYENDMNMIELERVDCDDCALCCHCEGDYDESRCFLQAMWCVWFALMRADDARIMRAEGSICILDVVFLWFLVLYWWFVCCRSLQRERCPSSQSQPALRHCHLHQRPSCWCWCF